jgi:hypothetical protein
MKNLTRQILEMLTETDDTMFGRISSGWDQDTDFDVLPTKMVEMTPELNSVIAGSEARAITKARKQQASVLGRISSGWDQDTDFDVLPTKMVEMTPELNSVIAGNINSEVQRAYEADYGVPEGEAGEFEEPDEEQFPMFKSALRHFQATMTKARPVRVDTEKSYDGFVSEKAVKEIERRLNELRAAVEQHANDGHATGVGLRKWDEIMGAAQAVSDLSSAKTAADAVSKLPEVPLAVPDFAKGKVKCFDDGDITIVSLRFAMPDGSPRIATMGARSNVDEESIQEWAESKGVDPITILGIVPALASVATGKKLLRDAAAAALEAQGKTEVRTQDDEPVVMFGAPDVEAPLAALMMLQQKADGGDMQAARELAIMRVAAQSPVGQKVAQPLLDEASKRLAAGKAAKTVPTSFADRYMVMSAFV